MGPESSGLLLKKVAGELCLLEEGVWGPVPLGPCSPHLEEENQESSEQRPG